MLILSVISSVTYMVTKSRLPDPVDITLSITQVDMATQYKVTAHFSCAYYVTMTFAFCSKIWVT